MTALQKAKAYLDARRGERVTLGELAQAVDVSPFHLQRRFKEAFGLSPRGYQDAYRVEAVKSSLQNGSRVRSGNKRPLILALAYWIALTMF